MPNLKMPFRALLSVITLIVLMNVRQAQACVCGSSASCSGAATAAAVFEATVETIEASPATDVKFDRLSAVRLANITAYRGEPAPVVFTPGGSSCAFPFKVGERYLIVAGRSQDGRLTVTECGLTRRIDEARGLIEYVKALTEEPIQTRVYGEVVRAAALLDEQPPVAGAEVTLRGPREIVVKTDANGRFLVRGLAHGSYSASAKIPGTDTEVISYFDDFELSPGVSHACAELKFVVTGTGQVTGIVVNDHGDPIARAFVYLRAVNESGPGRSRAAVAGTAADEVGRYHFFGVPPGRYQVTYGGIAAGQILARASDGSTTFSVNDGQLVTLETLQWIRPPKLPTEVTIRNLEGLPVPGVEVQPLILINGGEPYLAGAAVISDADGKFVVPLLRDQRYRLIVGSHRTPSAELEVVADGQPLTLVIRR